MASVLSALASLRESEPTRGAHPPFVTLTYAQSLDGSLSTARGAPTAISCTESLRLTHELRAAHAAILIGVGTALADDPRLTVRLCAGASPVPIVVDTHLRLPPHARLLSAAAQDTAVAPIVLHAPFSAGEKCEWDDRARRLRAAGARLVEAPLAAGSCGHIDLAAAFRTIAAPPMNLTSVMVEGGASLIASLCAQHSSTPALINAVVVTLAPFLLHGGLHVGAAAGSAPMPLRLDVRVVERVGRDLVTLLTPA
jgi:3,4-dihydroxy 2-butanone 4-phosphate synthase/GTP cyclohydrolase II